MKRISALMIGMTVAVCAAPVQNRVLNEAPPPAPRPSNVTLESYGQPFGYAPEKPNLAEVFLSLPDELTADMPSKMRRMYIEEYRSEGMNNMFDPKNKFAEYYNDNPYNPIQPSSIFYAKILSSDDYRYVVLVHMAKPCALDVPPKASNTFVLAPSGSSWIDITEKVLPKDVHRDWYFQPLRRKGVVETAPYERGPGGHWGPGRKRYDLAWRGNRFALQPPRTGRFTSE